MGSTKITVSSFMRGQIELMEQSSRFGTAKNYAQTLRSLLQFTGTDILLTDITEQTVGRYNAFLLERGVTRNTISFYMRILKAAYNKAVRQRLVRQVEPFRNVYTGIDRTRKRAIDESLIAQLYKLELPCQNHLELARDIFIFSYCTRGMSFVDVAYLQKSDIRDGVIRYERKKTGQPMTVLTEGVVEEIIARYVLQTKNSPYVFPILKSTNPSAAYKQYRSAVNIYNRSLKELSELLQIGCHLTSYTARHSWATAARNHEAPISVISAGLGHSSESTTQIYLASIENSVIDNVNRGIVERVVTSAADFKQ